MKAALFAVPFSDLLGCVMHYQIFYQFDICGTTMIGSEDVDAKNVEDAKQQVREKHPHAKLRFTQANLKENKRWRRVPVNEKAT
jgi:hypothetical protein